MFTWALDLWYARQRKIDLDILWPQCRAQAKDLDQAKTAFAIHVYNDRAWLWLGPDHIARIFETLE